MPAMSLQRTWPLLCRAEREARIILTCADGRLRSWAAAEFATAAGLTDCLVVANDVVLSPSIRGSKSDMENYLKWELKLKH